MLSFMKPPSIVLPGRHLQVKVHIERSHAGTVAQCNPTDDYYRFKNFLEEDEDEPEEPSRYDHHHQTR